MAAYSINFNFIWLFGDFSTEKIVRFDINLPEAISISLGAPQATKSGSIGFVFLYKRSVLNLFLWFGIVVTLPQRPVVIAVRETLSYASKTACF